MGQQIREQTIPEQKTDLNRKGVEIEACNTNPEELHRPLQEARDDLEKGARTARTARAFLATLFSIFQVFFRVARTRWPKGYAYNNGGLHSSLLTKGGCSCPQPLPGRDDIPKNKWKKHFQICTTGRTR